MASDDDFLLAPVPEPDTEPTPSERAHAQAFGELLEDTSAPPALSAEDRELLETATAIRAVSGKLTLSPARQQTLVDGVLREAIGHAPGAAPRPECAVLARPRATRRWLPWTIAGTSMAIAAAAIVALVVRGPAPTIPAAWRSRPTDQLIGRIAPEHAGDAGARLDTIFADRLEAFRERRWATWEQGR